VPARLEDLGGWRGLLGRVAAGADLTTEEAAVALGEILAGNATPAQIAALMFGLRCKGETVDEMTGMVSAMLGASERVVLSDDVAARVIDTCGTGGDRSGTINVSTIAALVVAAAGVPVCKHGGRAASSQAGSADLLEALGVRIEVNPVGVARCVAEVGIGFCFAPRYHPAMRHAIPVRRELGVPTAFNLLGPLANPARVRRQVLGVGDPAMAAKMVRVLAAGGADRVMVVHGAGGLDELSTTGPSTVHEFHAGVFTEHTVDPESLGLAPASLKDLLGGDAATNAALATAILAGETGPRRDIVVLNAAAGLVVGGACPDLESGLDLAAAAIDDGRAETCLRRLVKVSQEVGG
jgi:anthranilate phosphoribosyltransferase